MLNAQWNITLLIYKSQNTASLNSFVVAMLVNSENSSKEAFGVVT